MTKPLIPPGVRDFFSDAEFKGRAAIVPVHADDPAEAELVRSWKQMSRRRARRPFSSHRRACWWKVRPSSHEGTTGDGTAQGGPLLRRPKLQAQPGGPNSESTSSGSAAIPKPRHTEVAMNLRTLVWKELWERPAAMATSVLAILLGVAALVSMRHVNRVFGTGSHTAAKPTGCEHPHLAEVGVVARLLRRRHERSDAAGRACLADHVGWADGCRTTLAQTLHPRRA